jgi:hypothetical protein
MLGCRLEPFNHKLQEPPETDAHCTADPTQRDSLEQEPFNEGALRLSDHRICGIKHKGPATEFTAVILFPGMDMAVSLKPG